MSSTPSLSTQTCIPSDVATKIRLSMLTTALVDALGAPPEFQPRFSFPTVTEMIPNENFNLDKGIFTDDTSMMLCLAKSISTCGAKDGFDEGDQLDRYAGWWKKGELSAIGRCFDIGNTISRALGIWTCPPVTSTDTDPVKISKRRAYGVKQISKELSGDNFSGNGSLMRVLPVGLAYYAFKDERIGELARRSSVTTHPNELCREACEVWTGAIVRIIRAATSDQTYTKFDLLRYFTVFPYTQDLLRNNLSLPESAQLPSADATTLEQHYWSHHPLLRLIATSEKHGELKLPSEQDLSSSGYVLNTLICALYCFFATTTFEEGAIMAVNMGNDADTVGAVYAGLAGCWYASKEGEEDVDGGVFWSGRVKGWRDELVRRDLVEEVAEGLVRFVERVGSKSS